MADNPAAVSVLDTPAFIQQVRNQPAIWDSSCKEHGNQHKVATAWKHICKLNWPDFDTRPAPEKRNKCLEMQKKWKKLRENFIKELDKKERGVPTTKQQHHELLTFLIPKLKTTSSEPKERSDLNEDQKGAKRRRSEASVDPSGTSQEMRDRDREASEDKRFLLYLASHMQKVPRNSKLALQAEIRQLIAKYTRPISNMSTTDSLQN